MITNSIGITGFINYKILFMFIRIEIISKNTYDHCSSFVFSEITLSAKNEFIYKQYKSLLSVAKYRNLYSTCET